jgi:hypothetical protein
MATIVEETIVIKLSRISKGKDPLAVLIDSDLLTTIETVVQELVDASVVVEVSA